MEEHRLLLHWLDNAYGLQTALIEDLGTQLADFAGQGELETGILKLYDQIQRQANRVQECVERLGGATSSMNKGGLPTFLNTMRSLWPAPADQVMVRHLISDAAAIHFAIATLKAVIVVAQVAGDEETARICQDIIGEQQQIASWWQQQVPEAAHRIARSVGAGGSNQEQGGDGSAQYG